MATTESNHNTERRDAAPSGRHDPVPEVVDWAVSIVVSVVGLVLVGVGVWLYTPTGRAAFVGLLDAGGVDTTGLTTRAAVEAAGPALGWLAAVVVLIGSALVAGAALFVRARRRTRRRVARTGGSTATFWAAAVYGAAVATLGAFVPAAAVTGGGVAAWLYDGQATRVGAAAGLVGAVVLAPSLVVGGLAVLTWTDALGSLADRDVVVAVAAVGVQLLAAATSVGLGTLGGRLVDRIA